MRSSNAPETWLTNAVILTQNPKRESLRGNIRIIGNRIAAIQKSRPKTFSRNARVIDCEGLTLAPGFIQSHVHLCQTLFRNQADDLELLDWLSKRIWPFEAAHTEETLHTSALLGIHELLSTGSTCVLDMATVKHTPAVFEAVKKTGIRASVGKCLMDHPQTTPDNLRESTVYALSEALSLYREWHGREGDRIRVSYAPRFVVSCTEKLLKEVLGLAKEEKTLIHTHASENMKEIQMVKEMVDCENVEYLQQLKLTSAHLVLAHCIWLKPREMGILQRSGTHVVHCPSSNMKLASGRAHIPEMLEKGINVALGADGAPCNNNLNMFTEMRMAALVHKPGNGPLSMKAQQVLDMATLNGAKAMDWEDDIGSIEVGKKADIIALDLNCLDNCLPPLVRGKKVHSSAELASSIVYSTQSHHLEWTMVDGKVLYKNGRVAGINGQRLLEQVGRAQGQIARRANV